MGTIDAILDMLTGRAVSRASRQQVASVSVWTAAWNWYKRWDAFHRSREELRHLTDRDLRDIGITRAEANAELRKPPRFRV